MLLWHKWEGSYIKEPPRRCILAAQNCCADMFWPPADTPHVNVDEVTPGVKETISKFVYQKSQFFNI